MILTGIKEIWFYGEAVDFRKGLNGLIELVAVDLEKDPANGDVYIFRSKKASTLKLIFWKTDGFWLCQKRLKGKRFKFPRPADSVLKLSSEEMQWLFSGLNIAKAPKSTHAPSCFY